MNGAKNSPKLTPKAAKIARQILESRLESNAYHEAGHAVAAYLLQRGIEYVSIRPKDGTLGRCIPTQIKRVDEEQELLIILAGPFAEKVMTGSISQDSYGIDRDMWNDLALQLCGDRERVNVYLYELGLITQDTFTLPPVKAAVEALAQHLLRRRCLWGRAARRVIRDALYNQESDA